MQTHNGKLTHRVLRLRVWPDKPVTLQPCSTIGALLYLEVNIGVSN